MTKKFGIIGNPVKHSLSPVLHNYWFNKYKVDASYSIIDVKENELSTIVKKIKKATVEKINATKTFILLL